MKPDLVGLMGEAWQPDVEAIRAKSGRSEDAHVAMWIVKAPWAHPVWHSYVIYGIHLRPVPGMGPPKIYLQGATHEIIVFALDPEWKLNLLEVPRFLQPANFAGQFMAESDEAAAEAILSAVREVIQGTLNPDTDGLSQWRHRFGSHMIRKDAMPDSYKETPAGVEIKGTGAINFRKLIGPDSMN